MMVLPSCTHACPPCKTRRKGTQLGIRQTREPPCIGPGQYFFTLPWSWNTTYCHMSFLAFILPFPLNTVGRIFQSDIPSTFKNHNSIVHINSGRRCKDLIMCLTYKNKWKMLVRLDCDYLLWLWCGSATSQRQKFNNGLG